MSIHYKSQFETSFTASQLHVFHLQIWNWTVILKFKRKPPRSHLRDNGFIRMVGMDNPRIEHFWPRLRRHTEAMWWQIWRLHPILMASELNSMSDPVIPKTHSLNSHLSILNPTVRFNFKHFRRERGWDFMMEDFPKYILHICYTHTRYFIEILQSQT